MDSIDYKHMGEMFNQRIVSLQNPRVKDVVKLRKRSDRDEAGLLIIEGYREIKRALDNQWNPTVLFICRELFQGENEDALIERCRLAGAEILDCSDPVFRKMAYRDRPDGLLALAPHHKKTLRDIKAAEAPLLLVAEAIEKPGNLGTMLRSADAAGVDAMIVCDPCTDVTNPNVVRASTGALFMVPLVVTTSEEALAWLRARSIQIVAATPHASKEYTDVDLTRGVAFVMGAEQYGLSDTWMKQADQQVRIPMLGQADSLNVAAATTILLYEAVRQRRKK